MNMGIGQFIANFGDIAVSVTFGLKVVGEALNLGIELTDIFRVVKWLLRDNLEPRDFGGLRHDAVKRCLVEVGAFKNAF